MAETRIDQVAQSLYKTLKETGVSENEIKLYVSALRLGPSLISRLAKAMGVTRPNVYKVAKGLEKRSLGSFTGSGYKRRFAASSPTAVASVLREKRKELEKIDFELTQELPSLLGMFKQGELPTKISVIIEKERLMEAFAKVFEEADKEVLFLGSSEDLNQLVTAPRLIKLIGRRVRRGVRTKLLLFPGEAAKLFKSKDAVELRETRVIKNLSHFTTSFYLFANKAIFWQPKAPLAVLVEDEYLVQMLKSIFDHLWEETA